MPIAANDREFRVRARHVDAHHSRGVTERSFEAAAVAYVEDLPHNMLDEPLVSVIVQEVSSGHEQCFEIDLDTGDAAPCG